MVLVFRFRATPGRTRVQRVLRNSFAVAVAAAACCSAQRKPRPQTFLMIRFLIGSSNLMNIVTQISKD